MNKPKRSSDDYIQLNKKITDKEVRNVIFTMAQELRMTATQTCYEIIRERAVIEIAKRKK